MKYNNEISLMEQYLSKNDYARNKDFHIFYKTVRISIDHTS